MFSSLEIFHMPAVMY